MAYQAHRQKVISEDLELIGRDGEVAKTIHVNINTEAIAKDFNKAKNNIIRAQLKADSKDNDVTGTYEEFGNAVISLFEVVFGEADTADILAFYEDNYVEMAQEIMPFITDVVAPAIKQAVDEKKEILAGNYKLNRKQRRRLGI